MYILKPSDTRLRSKEDGWLGKLQVVIYQLILKWLMTSYRHYAILDTVSADRGRIKIVHEFRDLAFEEELRRNSIDIRPHLLSREISFVNSKGRNTCWFRYFKWKDLKTIYIDGDELFIKHNDSLSVNGNVEADVKSSSSEDIIVRSIVELKRNQKKPVSQMIHESVERKFTDKPKNTKVKQCTNDGLFRGETATKRVNAQSSAEAATSQKEEALINKHGFEIDATF